MELSYAILGASFIFLIIAYLRYLGVIFFPIVFNKDESLDFLPLIGRLHVGPYKKTTGTFYSVHQAVVTTILSGSNTAPGDHVGIYYDSPRTTPADLLRSFCAVQVAEQHIQAWAKQQLQQQNNNKSVDDNIDEKTINDLLLPLNLQYKKIPSFRARTTRFPLVSMLSYMIGPIRVYRSASPAWFQSGLVEVYQHNNKVTLFCLPTTELSSFILGKEEGLHEPHCDRTIETLTSDVGQPMAAEILKLRYMMVSGALSRL